MTDDELFDRLRAADSARALPPIDPDRAARLVEDTMNTHTDSTGPDSTDTARRSPLTWLVAAAAVVLLAGVAFWSFRPDTADVPAAQDPTSSATGDADPGQVAAPLALQAPDPSAYAARCMAPSEETLALADVAFAGEVTGVVDGTVTLTPTEWFQGDRATEVTVEAPPRDLSKLIQTVDFELGGTYLVAAREGTVMICGFSSAYDDGLADTYRAAFGA